jgi:hypothetical protein
MRRYCDYYHHYYYYGWYSYCYYTVGSVTIIPIRIPILVSRCHSIRPIFPGVVVSWYRGMYCTDTTALIDKLSIATAISHLMSVRVSLSSLVTFPILTSIFPFTIIAFTIAIQESFPQDGNPVLAPVARPPLRMVHVTTVRFPGFCRTELCASSPSLSLHFPGRPRNNSSYISPRKPPLIPHKTARIRDLSRSSRGFTYAC